MNNRDPHPEYIIVTTPLLLGKNHKIFKQINLIPVIHAMCADMTAQIDHLPHAEMMNDIDESVYQKKYLTQILMESERSETIIAAALILMLSTFW